MWKYFLLGCLICIPLSALAELRVFTLKHHFAEDLYAAVRPLVGADGTVTGIDNQLIVRATPSQLTEIEALIAQMDIPRVNRTITFQSQQTQDSNLDDTRISGNVKSGRIIIGNTNNGTPNRGRIDITRNSQQSTQRQQQFLQVLDGERAFIEVGTRIPFTQDWLMLTQRYAQKVRTTEWIDVSTGFAVRPRSIGDQVELEITPRIAQANRQQYIDFETLSTTVRISFGEWVNIGQTMQQSDEVSRKILGSRTSTLQANSNLIIKVD